MNILKLRVGEKVTAVSHDVMACRDLIGDVFIHYGDEDNCDSFEVTQENAKEIFIEYAELFTMFLESTTGGDDE